MAGREHISLREVEPSPVEDAPADKQTDYFTRRGYENSQRTNNLGLSKHSPAWYLSRIQKYSTYAFSAFAVAHIANTSIIPLVTRRVSESERYLLLTRPYYQGLPFEPLLVIIPVWAHVASGLALRIYRRAQNGRRYGEADRKGGDGFFSGRFWPRVSGISKLGFAFAPLLLGHAFINRGIPKQFPGGSSNINLSYVSHAFARHPAVSFAGFTALLTIGCFHITWGWTKWLGYTPDQTTEMGADRQLAKKRRRYVIIGVAATITGLWMAGSFGVIARGGAAGGWVGRQYDDMYRHIPLIGKWM